MAFVAVPAVIGGGAAIAAATTRIRRWTRDGDDDDDGDGFRGYKKVKDSRLAAWAPSKMYDRATQKIVEKALDALEDSVLDETPYFPRCLQFTNHIKASVWAEVKDELEDMINESLSASDKEYRELRLRNWAKHPHIWPAGHCLPNIYNWVRARFLYAVLPADANVWRVLRDPIAVFIYMLTLTPTYCISTWMFVVLFFFIEKSDEYQLVNYILKFKATQFLSVGIYTMGKLSVLLYDCLEGVLRNEAVEACQQNAPGQYAGYDYYIVMELVRVVFLYLAFFYLARGYAFGGKEELLALEHVRVDAADGSLDGTQDRSALKENLHLHADQDIDDDEYLVAIKSARELYDAKPKYGGSIRFFMLWDFLTIVAIVGVHALKLLSLDEYVRAEYSTCTSACEGEHHAQTSGLATCIEACGASSVTETFMFHATLSYIKTFYALFSWPFLIFMVPVVGGAFAEARPTAYDKSGMLCPNLSSGQLKTKYDFEKENQIGDFSPLKGWQGRLAMV